MPVALNLRIDILDDYQFDAPALLDAGNPTIHGQRRGGARFGSGWPSGPATPNGDRVASLLMPYRRPLDLDVEFHESIEQRRLTVKMPIDQPGLFVGFLIQQPEPRQGPKDTGFHRE
jgi:hypothetical protein